MLAFSPSVTYKPEEWKIHTAPEHETYGLNYPPETSQLAIELKCFNFAAVRKNAPSGVRSRFFHGLNIVRLLWGDQIQIGRWYIKPDGNKIYIWNNYFLKCFKALCTHKKLGLTGCASSGKTFTTAVYSLICFYSAPKQTTVLISTTSGSSSERRIWADIKELHRNALWVRNGFEDEDGNPMMIGEVVEYLKCLTFNSKEFEGGKANQRDLRNGVVVVPIANDSTGENALSTIVGTKNPFVIWAIDELPEMMDGVLQPVTNLNYNPWVQIIGIGNAKEPEDPHGKFCKPKDGWDSIDPNVDEEWEAGTCHVLFLHGEKSPNYHPEVNQDVESAHEFPFPKLSNSYFNTQTAIDSGDGNIDAGKKTLNYLRFAIGYWFSSSVSTTVLSIEQIKENHANKDPQPWGVGDREKIASFDPAFGFGGDANPLTIIEVGKDFRGDSQLTVKQKDVVVEATDSDSKNRESFRKMLAKSVVRDLLKEKIRPRNFCMDTSGDGGLILGAIILEWSQHVGSEAAEAVGLGTLEASSDKKYDDRCTEYWFAVPEIIETGCVRGFEINSKYTEDLTKRNYVAVGKGRVKIEKKDKKLKKKLGRSPDNGDSLAYGFYHVKNLGLVKVRSGVQLTEEYYEEEEEDPAWEYTTSDDLDGEYAGYDDEFAYM